MGRKSKMSMSQQIDVNLKSKYRQGCSRHNAKANGIDQQFIYSKNTLKTYKREMNKFANYCKEEYRTTNVSKMYEYADDYISYLKDNDYSAWTQSTALSAIKKFYQDEDFSNIEVDSRNRQDITRSRFDDTERSSHFSERLNAELVDFCRSTGLRRSELENLHGDCVSQHDDGNWYIDDVVGKGGRVRDVMILDNNQNVIDLIQNTSADDLVWGKVSTSADIHGYRCDYAKSLYEEVAKTNPDNVYYARDDQAGNWYDRDALLIVSENLGHSRESIVVSHYMYEKRSK